MSASTTHRVRFSDLAASHAELADDLEAAWREVSGSSGFIGGGPVARFESAWAAYCSASACISVGNGTDALELALAGLGIGPGDEVVVPANTFVATPMAVVAVGARPRFVDVDPATLLITGEHVSAALTPRTAAVIPVHLYGQMADMGAIAAVARAAGIAMIEDAAQAHGARRCGQPPGAHADAATYSFYPGKNLGAFGDGGAVTTNDEALAERIRLLSNHGRSPQDRFTHLLAGRNSRLDALQAALLSAKLGALDRWNEARRRAGARYRAGLHGVAVRTLTIDADSVAVHHVEPVFVADRDRVAAELRDAGIETNLHYPIPCHLQPAFAPYRVEALPVVEEAARTELSLPMHPHLSDEDVDHVCRSLQHSVEQRS